MHIAIFTDIFLDVPGGIPSSISAQKKGFESLGHQVTIFCPGFPQQNLKKNQKTKEAKEDSIVLVPTHKILRPNKAPLARRPEIILSFIERLYPNFANIFDVIHVHYEASCSIAGIFLAKKYHIKLIQTMHGREDIAIDTNIITPFKFLLAFLLDTLHNHYLSSPPLNNFKLQSSSKSPSKHVFFTKSVPKKDNFLIRNSVHQHMWALMVRQANIADAVIAPTLHFANNLKHYGVTKQIHVISNGVDDQLLHPPQTPLESNTTKTKKPNSRLVYFFPITPQSHNPSLTPSTNSTIQSSSVLSRNHDQKKSLRIIWSSRVSKEKRIMPFLIALSNSKNRSYIHCTIIGTGNDYRKAKRYVKQHHLSPQITFLGDLPHQEVLHLLKTQHLSVINSYGFDTQGMTILEAIACGIPILYADPAMDEVVPTNGGLRTKDSSIPSLTEAIDYLFDHPETITQMSKVMQKHKKSVLQSSQIKKLISLYKSL